MKSLKHLEAQALNATEMVKTKGGSTITIDVALDICVINPTTGQASLLYCDRRRKRVNA